VLPSSSHLLPLVHTHGVSVVIALKYLFFLKPKFGLQRRSGSFVHLCGSRTSRAECTRQEVMEEGDGCTGLDGTEGKETGGTVEKVESAPYMAPLVTGVVVVAWQAVTHLRPA
jgi:hypothetical protein